MAPIILIRVKHALVAAGAALALAVAGCGGADEPPPITGPAKEAAATIDAFERAARRRDFRTICNELLAAEARRQSGGRHCPARLRRRARRLRQPRVEVLEIDVRGRDAASVRVRARAAGDPARVDTVELVREVGRFRIASLAD